MKISRKRLDILLILGVVGFFLLLRWNSFNVQLQRDEGAFAYAAWLMTQGKVPYVDNFDHKPPMIVYTYLLSFFIDSEAFWPPRLLATIFEIGTILLIGLILKKEFGRSTAFFAMYLIPPMITLSFLAPFVATPERFLLLPLFGCIALYVYKKEKKTGPAWFWFGVLSAIACYYKPMVLPLLAFVYFVWIVRNWEKYLDKKSWCRNNFYAFLGFILTSFVVFGFFIVKGAMGSVWESVIFFNRHYLENFGFSLDNFWYFGEVFLKNWWALVILLGWFVYSRPRNWWFYLGLFIICFLTIFTSPIGYYYVVLVPFWAVVGAISIASFFDFIKKKTKFKLDQKLEVGGFCVLLAIIISPLRKQLLLSPAQLNIITYGRMHPFAEALIVAKRLVEMTGSEDYVFIGGSEAQILYYAKRKSSSRFTNVYPLTVYTPKIAEYQKQAILELKVKPPEAIVYSQMQSSWLWNEDSPDIFAPYFLNLLREKYDLLGGFIWQDKHGFWQEPIEEDQAAGASMLLFKKKG